MEGLEMLMMLNIMLLLVFSLATVESVTEGTLGVFIFCVTGILVSMSILEVVKKRNYIHFRDNNYTNYSNNIDYKHWLFDNQKDDE
jgi:hypothetical protein